MGLDSDRLPSYLHMPPAIFQLSDAAPEAPWLYAALTSYLEKVKNWEHHLKLDIQPVNSG